MLIKGENVHGLYLLKGVTTKGETCVDVGSPRDLDVIRLRRLRLGHISKKNLNIFWKRKMIDGKIFNKLVFCEECFMEKQFKV